MKISSAVVIRLRLAGIVTYEFIGGTTLGRQPTDGVGESIDR